MRWCSRSFYARVSQRASARFWKVPVRHEKAQPFMGPQFEFLSPLRTKEDVARRKVLSSRRHLKLSLALVPALKHWAIFTKPWPLFPINRLGRCGIGRHSVGARLHFLQTLKDSFFGRRVNCV